LERETKLILNCISKYYQKYKECEQMSVNELRAFFEHLNPQIDTPEIYRHLFQQIENTSIDNAELLTDILKTNVERHLMTQIGRVATDVVNYTRNTGAEEVYSLLEEYEAITGNIRDAELEAINMDFDELFFEPDNEGLEWRLPFLQDRLGHLKPAILGHIFARPDGGKTSLALFELVKMSRQCPEDRPPLYLSNEEAIKRINRRAWSASMGWSQSQIVEDEEKAKEAWLKWHGDRIRFFGGVNHLSQVERYLKALYPRVVIIDQGPKLNVSNRRLEGVARLQYLYNRYRDMAGEYDCSIITLGQADNAAENKKYLNLNNMDSSKVAIPGELDFCLGIGRVNDPGYENVRYLNVCKNKLTGLYGSDQVTFEADKCFFS
jgi:hypothetical protein